MRNTVTISTPLVEAMEAAVQRCRLDLRGLSVLTEAATGNYAVTASLAGLAGARRVFAFARDSRHSTRGQAIGETALLAQDAGVASVVEFVPALTREVLAAADIVTNSGHLRPLCRHIIQALKPTAVIPLMYEAWEFRASDLDLAACTAGNIPVAGTNECHPAFDVFSCLGALACRQLADAGLSSGRVLVLCDNPFSPHLVSGLTDSGWQVELADSVSAAIPDLFYDAVLVALRPGPAPRLNESSLATLAGIASGAVLAQFWGDIQRSAAQALGFRLWPPVEPARGHMGILLSALGPEPIIRLQSGGLKVGEIMARAQHAAAAPDFELAVATAVASGFGQRI